MSTEQPKEALTQIENENKPSIFTLEDFVSTFPKHQQEQYWKYRRALELHQLYLQGDELWTQAAIAKELSAYYQTVRAWIKDRHSPYIEKHICELKELGLWPLISDNPHLTFFATQAGWLMGDGHLTKDLHYLWFYEREKKSLENLKAEYQAHFPKLSISDVEKDSLSNGYELTVYNTTLAHLFAALGVPVGNKVEVSYSVPQFVLNGSDEVKCSFFGTLLLCEVSSPILVASHSANTIHFSLSKKDSLEEEHLQVIEEIRRWLGDSGITTGEVEKVKHPPPANPSYRIPIDGRAENLIKFHEMIKKPLELFPNKQRAIEEVMEAFKYHIKREELYRKALALKAEDGDKTIKEIYRELKMESKQKFSYGTIRAWIEGEYKPILAKRYPS